MRCAVGFVRPGAADQFGHRQRFVRGRDQLEDHQRLAAGAERGGIDVERARSAVDRGRDARVAVRLVMGLVEWEGFIKYRLDQFTKSMAYTNPPAARLPGRPG